MKRYITVVTILLAFLSFSCEDLILDNEPPKPPVPKVYDSKLATLLDSLRYELDLPALAGAIVTDTGIVDAQAVGCRRYGGPANVTVNDKFYLASCGKAFTAVLMATLVDEGRVSWTTTLPTIFPEHANTMQSEYRDVTVRDLLSHSAGFVRDPDNSLQTSRKRPPREQRAEVVKWALSQPPAIQRGAFLYSNLGYMIAGAIAERLADRSYEELIFERVLLPLGITTAGIGAMGTPGLEDQPLQHTANHAPIEPTSNASLHPIYNPAGNLYMSIGDWGKFIQWVLAIEAGHQTLLKPETARTTVIQWGTGSNLMNYAATWLDPNRRFAVIAATNQGQQQAVYPNPLEPVVNEIINFYLKGN